MIPVIDTPPVGKRYVEQPRTERILPQLTIVIPALNEEGNIASIVERCVAARAVIQQDGCVRDVEIIVVNDGSTDRTSEIAKQIAQSDEGISVIDFEKNRGYGAALKEGFRRGTGELVSFLDADGTCDPVYFAEMCRRVQLESADIVLGSRMGSQSKMPTQRRIGNRMFAVLLGFLSDHAVKDTASGMRVIRREVLSRLYPLPNGLQFTPAMSARAILNELRILEIDMTYSERVGESKLHPFRDGIRFLAAILSATLLYRPTRLFGLAATLCSIVAFAWGLYPVEFYLREGFLEEWMIYRILLCTFLLTCSFGLSAAGVLANQIRMLVHERQSERFVEVVFAYAFAPSRLILFTFLAVATCIGLTWSGLVQYISTGQTSLHWSRAIVAAFFLQLAVGAASTALLQKIIQLWKSELCAKQQP